MALTIREPYVYLFKSIAFVGLLSVSTAFSLSAQIVPPKNGEVARDFTGQDLEGVSVQLSKLYSAGPVVLVILRGFPGYQCPVCNRQVQELVKYAGEFKEVRASVVMIYPGMQTNAVDKAREFASNKKLPGEFVLVPDPGYVIVNRYGLRWDAPNETAYPSTFLIQKGGSIFYTKISDSHGGRSSAQELVAMLKNSADSLQ